MNQSLVRITMQNILWFYLLKHKNLLLFRVLNEMCEFWTVGQDRRIRHFRILAIVMSIKPLKV